MVVPVSSSEKTKSYYLPKGNWYNIYTDYISSGEKEYTSQVPFHQIPVFVKASSILPMQSTVQSTREKPSDTLFVHVFYGNEKSSYTFYEDDGETMAYNDGGFRKREINYIPAERQLLIGKANGSFTTGFTHIQCVFHGFPEDVSTFFLNGKPLAVKETTYQLLNGLQHLDDLYDKNYLAQLKAQQVPPKVKTIVVRDTEAEMNIQWH
jgi:alpha-glucosidase